MERVRGEYAVSLFGLVLGVELFIASIPFVAFYKLKVANPSLARAHACPHTHTHTNL